jgi:hypothetical protein
MNCEKPGSNVVKLFVAVAYEFLWVKLGAYRRVEELGPYSQHFIFFVTYESVQ